MTENSPDSLRWPAEWQRHEATWLAWPHNGETWPVNLKQAQQEFVDFVRLLAQVEPVHLLCGQDEIASAKNVLGNVRQVEFIDFPTNDAWIRDYGPTFVEFDGVQVVIDWKYNAWGGKYPPFDRDAAIAGEIAKRLQVPARKVNHVVEGGAIEGNGEGVVMTTRSCLLNDNRNAQQSESIINSALKENLGAKEIWWLSGGEIAGDDTDSHIDQIARFVSASSMVVASEADASDANYVTLRDARNELDQLNLEHDNCFSIVDLPMPGEIIFENTRLPASYANFYFANELTVVPQFGDRNDARAISVLRELVPGEIIGLPCRHLVVGLGSFHCLSQQQPSLARPGS